MLVTMVKKSAKEPGPRRPLSRDRILATAIRLADREGVESMSMRRLGRELGVEAMSLYNHVHSKEDLIDGMVGVVFSEIDLPGEADWKSEMRRRAISMRSALISHPWAIGLMESRRQAEPAILRHHDAVLGALRKAGFSIELAAHAYAVLDAYIYGFALTELTLPFSGAEGATEVAENIFKGIADQYPYLAEMTVEHAMKAGYSYGNEFGYGLDLILDGLSNAQKKKRA